MRLNKFHSINDNSQYVEIWRSTTVTTRGDFTDVVSTMAGKISLRDSVKVDSFKARIVRSRRGRRTNEQITSDSISVSTLEWVMFYPKGSNVSRGDKAIDRQGQVYNIISYTSSETFPHLNEAVLREAM